MTKEQREALERALVRSLEPNGPDDTVVRRFGRLIADVKDVLDIPDVGSKVAIADLPPRPT